jgi:hypothetical protein
LMVSQGSGGVKQWTVFFGYALRRISKYYVVLQYEGTNVLQ